MNKLFNQVFQMLFFSSDGKQSHARFWSNVGELLVCISYSIICIKLIYKIDFIIFPTETWIAITLTFSSIVIFPWAFEKILNYKLNTNKTNDKNNEQNEVKEGEAL